MRDDDDAGLREDLVQIVDHLSFFGSQHASLRTLTDPALASAPTASIGARAATDRRMAALTPNTTQVTRATRMARH